LTEGSSSSSLLLPGVQLNFKGVLQGGMAGDAHVSPVAGTIGPLFKVGIAHSCRDGFTLKGGKMTVGRERLLGKPTSEGENLTDLPYLEMQAYDIINISQGDTNQHQQMNPGNSSCPTCTEVVDTVINCAIKITCDKFNIIDEKHLH
jgi:hypothetical protein